MLLDDVASRLVTQGVGGLPGTTQITDTNWTITKGFQPPDPDRMITIYETGGPAAEVIPPLDYRHFQVRIRAISTGYSTASQKLMDCETALHGLANTTINGWYYPLFNVLSGPIHMGLDGNDRPELVQNFRAMRSRT